MDTKELLTQARDLIYFERHWTQGVNACDENGDYVDPKGLGACRWCAEGALVKVAHGEVSYEVCELLNDAANDLYGIADFVEVNDQIGHDAIISVFTAAIARS